MTTRDWRPIAPHESATVRAIVSAPSIADGDLLLRDLKGAFVRNSAAWILDVKAMTSDTPGAGIPDRPFPLRAFVSNKGSYQGEIIVWITAGRVSGLEIAWVSDAPSYGWPQPEEMDIEVQ